MTKVTSCKERINMYIVNILKFGTLPFLFSNKMLVIRVEIHKCRSEYQTGKTLIRLVLQNQSDLGMPYLSWPFGQATSVRNF